MIFPVSMALAAAFSFVCLSEGLPCGHTPSEPIVTASTSTSVPSTTEAPIVVTTDEDCLSNLGGMGKSHCYVRVEDLRYTDDPCVRFDPSRSREYNFQKYLGLLTEHFYFEFNYYAFGRLDLMWLNPLNGSECTMSPSNGGTEGVSGESLYFGDDVIHYYSVEECLQYRAAKYCQIDLY